MEILLAAMAFSVLMIVFSTAATGLTETFLRVSSIRADILAKTVLKFLQEDPSVQSFITEKRQAVLKEIEERGEVLDEKIKALILDTSSQADKALGEIEAEYSVKFARLESLQDKLTKNTAIIEPITMFGTWFKTLRGTVSLRKSHDRVDTLSTYSFLQRLAQSDVGKTIAKETNDIALRGMTIGLERYVAASNELFRKRAQATTMVIAIVMALATNINVIPLSKYLIENPSISENIIATAETAKQNNDAAVGSLNATIKELEAANANQDATDEDIEKLLGDVKDDLNAVQVSLSQLSGDFNLPIGYGTAPDWTAKCNWDTDFSPLGINFGNIPNALGCTFVFNRAFYVWLFGTVLAGFLIGLGGPFWYKAFSALSSLAQVLRSFGGNKSRSEKISSDETTGANASQPASRQLVDALNPDKDHKLGGDDLLTLFRAFAGFREGQEAKTK